ncbi:MAG: AEC family transporter [Candidatus Nomurabacteria bacterium]|jgi:predicted permease|nr:AEC family transporter [Candidatus Nomurabacteria bacterium]
MIVDVDLGIFYTSLVTVVLIILVGLFVSKKGWVDGHANKTIINLLLNVAWPCALLLSFPSKYSQEHLENFLWGAGGGFLILVTVILVSRLLFRKKRHPNNYFEYQFAFIFNNASFLGFPLVSTIYGQEGLVPYSGFIIVFNLALFGYGVALFRDNYSIKELAKTFLNPCVIAVLLGFLMFLSSFELPKFGADTVRHIGALMTPLSLICIGYMLSRAKLKQIFRQKILVLTCLAQLILDPLITFLVLKLIGAPILVIQIIVLIQALPTATSLGLFAEKYRSKDKYGTSHASELVAVSTILSAVTLPVILWVMFNLLGL